jgi:AcrR family transcriptional regulator
MSTKREKTRESLLEAAWKRLERGDEAKLEDVGKDAGVSRQAVYLHFGSRGGMLLALVAYVDEKLGLPERLRVAHDTDDPVQQLENVLRMVAGYEPEVHGVAMALLRLADADEEMRAAFEDRMQRRRQGIAAIVKRVSGAGLLREEWSVGEVSDVLFEVSAPSSYQILVVEQGWKPARFGDWLVWQGRSFLRKSAKRG